jgi:hypothetical protein
LENSAKAKESFGSVIPNKVSDASNVTKQEYTVSDESSAANDAKSSASSVVDDAKSAARWVTNSPATPQPPRTLHEQGQ